MPALLQAAVKTDSEPMYGRPSSVFASNSGPWMLNFQRSRTFPLSGIAGALRQLLSDERQGSVPQSPGPPTPSIADIGGKAPRSSEIAPGPSGIGATLLSWRQVGTLWIA